VQFIDKCLLSVLHQTYQDWEMSVFDDGSDDGTQEKLPPYLDDSRIKLTATDRPTTKPLGGLLIATDALTYDPDDVVINLDADDWLSGPGVLGYLAEVYKDPEVWLTYGQYVPVSRSYSNHCAPIVDTRTYRKSGQWHTSHLRTYRKHLFDRVDRKDFLDDDGIPTLAGDVALMMPMIEMAGKKHIRFIDQVLYVYNDKNPLCEMHVNSAEQTAADKKIRTKPVYDELP
jgi:glycosyltransferase involved in cell wall biosynthesis